MSAFSGNELGMSARSGTGRKNQVYYFIEIFAGMSANHETQKAAIGGVKKVRGHFVFPLRIHATDKSIFVSHFLADTREDWFVALQEMLNQIDGGVVVHIHPEDGEAFRGVIASDLIDDGEFVAARFAPGGPEGDEEGLTLVVGEKFVVSGEND